MKRKTDMSSIVTSIRKRGKVLSFYGPYFRLHARNWQELICHFIIDYYPGIPLPIKHCSTYYPVAVLKQLSYFRDLHYGLGAKIKKNRSVAPPRKKNSIATMHQVYISGAWKTMFD